MFLLVTGRAKSRSRSDEPIRTQRDRSTSRDRVRRSKRRSEKESDSSNKCPPIIIGPLTTNQDLVDTKGETIYNLPLMIQQPFLRAKKDPIKVDISVKLIPKSRKKEKKRRGAQIDEIVVQADEFKGVNNNISMEVSDRDVHVLNETVEIIEEHNSDANVVQDDDKISEEDQNIEKSNEPQLENASTSLEPQHDLDDSVVPMKTDDKILADDTKENIDEPKESILQSENTDSIMEETVKEKDGEGE